MFAFNSSDLDHLVEEGVGVYGIVTAKEPNDHQGVKYYYQVNGKNYQGNGSAGRGNADFNQIQIGQKVIVYYDFDNPEKAILSRLAKVLRHFEKFRVTASAVKASARRGDFSRINALL